MDNKYKNLKEHLAKLDSLAIAFSGGVDSTVLLKVAYDVLKENALAVTADSPSIPRSEMAETIRLAKKIGASHLVIATKEIENQDYRKNPPNRCYFCKSELYSNLIDIALERGIKYIVSGTNLDDLSDYRPGLQAADEYHIISPLKDAGFTKTEIRELAKKLNLDVWDKPASPCLSSRIPYGSEVTSEKLLTIERAEQIIRNFSINELRVRHFGEKARIEVAFCHFKTIEGNWQIIQQKFQDIGFKEIELKEFKSGALNDLLKKQPRFYV